MSFTVDKTATGHIDNGTSLTVQTSNPSADGIHKVGLIWTFLGNSPTVTYPAGDAHTKTLLRDAYYINDGGYFGWLSMWLVDIGTGTNVMGGSFSWSGNTCAFGGGIIFGGADCTTLYSSYTIGKEAMYNSSSGTTYTESLAADVACSLEVLLCQAGWHNNSNGGGSGMSGLTYDAAMTSGFAMETEQSPAQGRQGAQGVAYRQDGASASEDTAWTWGAATSGHYPNLYVSRILLGPPPTGGHGAWAWS